jgi:hypothetical protein
MHTALSAYRKVAKDLAAARKLRDDAQQQITKLENQLWVLGHEAKKELPQPKYKYTAHVSIHTPGGFGSDKSIPIGVEVLQLTGTCINKEEASAELLLSSQALEDRHSLRYWRHNGKIVEVGGGYLVLQAYGECSDAEWERLKQGMIPDHLLHKSDW